MPALRDDDFAIVLAQVAREQGVAGLLHDAISEQRADWPHAGRTALREALQDDFMQGVRQLDTASRVQDLLAARGVRSLPLKGAALAERLYDSVAHRSMGDVDMLALDSWSLAVSVLEDAGFREQHRADHAIAFLDPAVGTVVELHHGITSCGRLFPVDLEATWRRCRTGSGLMKRVPSTEDLLFHLSLHAAFQHGLVLRLVQFLDFRRLLEREPPAPGLLAQVAVGAPAQRAVALALEAARALVAAPISPALEKLITAWLPTGLRRYLIAKLRSDPAALLSPAEPPLARIRWQLAAGRRMALVRGTLAPSLPSLSSPTGIEAARALRLARRWALPTLRSLRAASNR